MDSVGVPTEDDLASRPAFCGWVMQKYSRTQQIWEDLYFFTERADLQPDFDMMNFWIANHQSSIFREVSPPDCRDTRCRCLWNCCEPMH